MNLYSKLSAGQYSGKLIELYAIEPLDSPMKTERIPFGWGDGTFSFGKLSVVADRMLIIERTYNNYRVSAVLHRPSGDYSLFSDAARMIPPASSQNNRRFALLCESAIGCSLDFIFGFISLSRDIGISIFLMNNHRFQNVLYTTYSTRNIFFSLFARSVSTDESRLNYSLIGKL